MVYGYGNPGRQDDGAGIRFCEAVEALRAAEGRSDVAVETNYQLNAEDAVLVAEYDEVLFVDAVAEGEGPFVVRCLEPAGVVAFSTHAMSPEAVLALCEELFGRSPRARMLGIRGYAWEAAEEMTEGCRRNMEAALAWFRREVWGGAVGDGGEGGTAAES